MIWLEFQGKWVIKAFPWPARTLKSPYRGDYPGQEKESGGESNETQYEGRGEASLKKDIKNLISYFEMANLCGRTNKANIKINSEELLLV